MTMIMSPTSRAHMLTDNDDDGETAAGGRLAHLLQILVCLETCPTCVRQTDAVIRMWTVSL